MIMEGRARTVGETQPSRDAVYLAVAARRLQFDVLLWQVPALALPAQGAVLAVQVSEAGQAVRWWLFGLAVLVAVLVVWLMARHRQAELADAEWLGRFETEGMPLPVGHGPGWAARRNQTPVRLSLIVVVWMAGLCTFPVASLALALAV